MIPSDPHPSLAPMIASVVAIDARLAVNPWCREAFALAAAARINALPAPDTGRGYPDNTARIAAAREEIEDRTDGPLSAFGFMMRAAMLAACGVHPDVVGEALHDSLNEYGWLAGNSESIYTGT